MKKHLCVRVEYVTSHFAGNILVIIWTLTMNYVKLKTIRFAQSILSSLSTTAEAVLGQYVVTAFDTKIIQAMTSVVQRP